MTSYYLRAQTKSSAHHVVFPAGKIFDRVEEFFVVSNAPSGTTFLPPLTAKVQEGITSTEITRMDYLPAFGGIPLFSSRFVDALENLLINEVNFYPCTLTCENTSHQFYVARILNRLHLLDYTASGLGGKPHPNFLRSGITENFYLAREKHPLKCYAFIASDAFKNEVEKLGLKIAFEAAAVHTVTA